jgi:hypothetical protein
MSKYNSPCLNCEDRHFICHDTCIKYKEFKASNEVARTNRENYKEEIEITVQSTERANKRRRGGNR